MMNSNTTLSNKRDEIFTLCWDLNNETKCDENILYYTKWYRDAMQEYAEWYHEYMDNPLCDSLKDAKPGFCQYNYTVSYGLETKPISHDLTNTNTITQSEDDCESIGLI